MNAEDNLLIARLEKNRLEAYRACSERLAQRGSPAMLRDLKGMMEARGFQEGNTSRPGDFVIERAFADQ